MSYRLERTQIVPRPLDEVFAFFSNAANLEAITPAFVGFHILTPMPIEMKPGALIEYRLALWGVPVKWTTRIELFEVGRRFVDVQLPGKGPYKRWHHTHEFAAVPEGTRMRDVVEYELPLGPLGSIAHALFVRRSLARIFDFRRERIAALLGPRP